MSSGSRRTENDKEYLVGHVLEKELREALFSTQISRVHIHIATPHFSTSMHGI
jgi:hypothetical protein